MARPKSAFHQVQLEAYCDILNKLLVHLPADKWVNNILASCDMLCERYEITNFKVHFDKLNNQFTVIKNDHERSNKNR